MASENLGRVSRLGMYEIDGKPMYTTKMFTMKDMLGGGEARLSQNAAMSMMGQANQAGQSILQLLRWF
ncbi:MAG: hypothetical protein LBS30_00670 [Planctomycetota bacterium]|nr:hypothetical protein [Planctomycetota bacterium]